jgi:glutamate transport system permease protein
VSIVLDNVDLVLKAFTYTVLLFLVAGVLSMIGGVVLVALRVGPVGVLRVAAGVYVTVVRNTPLLVIFLFFAIAAPKIGLQFTWVDVHIGKFDFTQYFAGAVVALTLYTSCFVCEALRSGINAVPMGQAEAARAIGLPFGSVMSQIVLPQAIRASVPPVASVQIALLKNTTVAAAFGLIEAAAQMRGFTNDHADQRWGIFLAFSLIFVILVEAVSLAAGQLERRWRIA